ncbi:MAG TPA: hypothetical protein VKE96_27360 [Vicinamibacterales bacterium]|nr:hypothetical protein [Vicinamibacterales bacterium]
MNIRKALMADGLWLMAMVDAQWFQPFTIAMSHQPLAMTSFKPFQVSAGY